MNRLLTGALIGVMSIWLIVAALIGREQFALGCGVFAALTLILTGIALKLSRMK